MLFALDFFLFNIFCLTLAMELTICPVKRELLAITRQAQRDEVATGAAQLQSITSFRSMKFSKVRERFCDVFAFLVSLVLSRPLKSLLNLVHLKERKKVKLLNHVRLSATPSTKAYKAPPSMGFSRQEY